MYHYIPSSKLTSLNKQLKEKLRFLAVLNKNSAPSSTIELVELEISNLRGDLEDSHKAELNLVMAKKEDFLKKNDIENVELSDLTIKAISRDLDLIMEKRDVAKSVIV